MILLDTVVLSELRKRQPAPQVTAWLSNQKDADLYLSVVSIGEIERGIRQCERQDPAFARILTEWLDGLLLDYADRVLPITPAIARRWGTLSAKIGHDSADLLIASTALCHGLTVATRNVRHFAPTGVDLINPFA